MMGNNEERDLGTKILVPPPRMTPSEGEVYENLRKQIRFDVERDVLV